MGKTLLEMVEAEKFKQPACPTVVLSRTKTETGVLPGGEMGEQGVVLKHHPHAAPLRWQPPPIAGNQTMLQMHGALRRPFKAGNQPQQSGLTATGGAQQSNQLPCCELQIDTPECPLLTSVLEAVPEITKLNRRG